MTDEPHEEFARMAAPGEEHQRLAPFVGTFRAEVKMWMGPGEPSVSMGTMINELDLGGRFLRQTYKGDAGEGPFPDFEGRGYWGFNKATGKYEGFWIDTASTMMQTEVGDVDSSGRVWTMRGELTNPQTGETLVKKSVLTLTDDDHHTMAMFFETPDGDRKSMEVAYTRES